MANQMIEPGTAIQFPTRVQQNAAEQFRAAELSIPHRITDRALIRRARAANGRAKRAFDIIASAAALLFLAPAFLTIAVIMKLTDPGPIFYRHTRVGRHGKRFQCLKFRTMAIDSAERLAHILTTDPYAAQEWETSQKLKNDPRVTPFGVFLRKTSLDELPQLINILRGEMSVVGPRPITRAELNRYGRERRYYLLVRPGLTGLWQVNGRSSVSYEKRIAYDRQYVEEWSWMTDVKIIVMTIPAVLKTSDAC